MLRGGHVVVRLDRELILQAPIRIIETKTGGVQTIAHVVVIGTRVQLEQRSDIRIDSLVPRIVGHEVILLNRPTGWFPLKDALLRQIGRHDAVAHDLLMGPASLIVSKDEQFIVLDRRAHGAAETVLNEYGPGYTGAIAEKIVGIEIGVAQIVEEVAVIFVRAGAGDQL